MEVEEQNEQSEASGVDTEAACGQQIASASSNAVVEAEDNKQNENVEASTSQAAGNDVQQLDTELNGETMVRQDVKELCNENSYKNAETMEEENEDANDDVEVVDIVLRGISLAEMVAMYNF